MSDTKYEFQPGELVVVLDGSAGHGRVARVLEVTRNYRTQDQYDTHIACYKQSVRWGKDGGEGYFDNPPNYKVGDEIEHSFATEGVLSANFKKGPRVNRNHRAIDLAVFDVNLIEERCDEMYEGLRLAKEICGIESTASGPFDVPIRTIKLK